MKKSNPIFGLNNQLTFMVSKLKKFKSITVLAFIFNAINAFTQCPPQINLGPDLSVCSNQMLTLSPGNYSNFLWQNGSTNPTLDVNTSGVYWVETTGLGSNLIVNGDFEMGMNNFDTDYLPGGGGLWGPLSLQGTYAVANSPNTVHNQYIDFNDHTPVPGTNMLVVNGAGNPGVNVWCQTIPVQANTTYEFGTWVASTIDDPAVAQLQFSVNGVMLGNIFSPTQNSGNWLQFTENWMSGMAVNAQICVINQNTVNHGNDFVIDDITFAPICTSRDSININFVPAPTAGNDISIEKCYVGETFNINTFLDTMATAGGQWSETSVNASGSFNSVTTAWNTQGLTAETYNFEYAVNNTLVCPNDTAIISIIFNSTNILNLGNDTTICQGSALVLDAGGYDGYEWNDGSSNQTLQVNQPGTYWVKTKTLGNNVIQNGDFELGANNFITDYMTATGGGFGLLSTPGQYAISSSPSIVHVNFVACDDHTINPGQNQFIVNGAGTPNTNVWCQNISVQQNTEYDFSTWVSSVENDPNVAQLQFSINGNQLGIIFSPSPIACQWTQFTETWNSGIFTNAQICILNQNNTSAGNDFAIDDITFRPVCIQTDSIVILNSFQPIAAVDQILQQCFSESGSIDFSQYIQHPSEPNGNNWTLPSNLPLGSFSSDILDISNLNPDNYLFYNILPAASPCIQDTTLISLTITPSEIPVITASILEGCEPLEVIFTCTNPNGVTDFSWNFGDGTSLSTATPSISHIFTGENCFDISLITNTMNSCVNSTSETNFICSHSKPQAQFSFYQLAENISMNDAQFLNNSIDNSFNYWNFDNQFYSTIENPSYSFYLSNPNEHFVQLIVENDFGCRDTTIKFITLKDPVIFYIPNSFTPDGLEHNEIFEPIFTSGIDLYSTQFNIYNRWGELIFEWSPENNYWDGTFKGQNAQEGTYTWSLRLKVLDNDEVQEFSGHVNLIK